ncbi:MAG: hypothetical protein HXY26_07555 [Hydrogenophilaceae bacterium]|nr:hypothetical protein [Hydrogenophilaceae bacterium]
MYEGGLKNVVRSNNPTLVALTVKGYTSGTENNRATEFWQRQFSKSLTDTQVLVPASPKDQPKAKLDIQIDNVADIGQAAGKGFITGLTFGLAGSTVTDGYVMKATYTNPEGKAINHEYRHAIHSMIGNTDPPPGVETMSPLEAVARVTDDLVAKLLRDLRKDGAY